MTAAGMRRPGRGAQESFHRGRARTRKGEGQPRDHTGVGELVREDLVFKVDESQGHAKQTKALPQAARAEAPQVHAQVRKRRPRDNSTKGYRALMGPLHAAHFPRRANHDRMGTLRLPRDRAAAGRREPGNATDSPRGGGGSGRWRKSHTPGPGPSRRGGEARLPLGEFPRNLKGVWQVTSPVAWS